MDDTERPLPAAGPATGTPGDGDGDATGLEPAGEVSADGTAAAAAVASPPPSRPRRAWRAFRRVVHLPRSGRGWAALGLLTAAFLVVMLAGAVQVLAWTETADFCGRCHTMGPELASHAAGPHADVSCGECHVAPGVDGWLKAKIQGTRQLVEIVLGTFPEPIPPPEHESLPPANETCVKCHSLPNLGTTRLITRVQYTADEHNTRQFVALIVRPRNGDFLDASQGVHWHVLQDVEFVTSQANAQVIPYVKVATSDGQIREFVDIGEVKVSDDARPDIDRLIAAGEERRMDCRDCHNRIGHPLPNPRREVDTALNTGTIDPSLPWIKAQAMAILKANYATTEIADAAVEGIREYYRRLYPLLSTTKAAQIDAAIDEIKLIYRLAATPEMKVTSSTYPDNLGHMDFVGCFRCHDGAHYLVVDGKLTGQAIPSSCDTCHTFPQIGQAIANLPLGVPPASHDDRLWVFDHRSVASSVDPGGTDCGECHARDYCVNCHKTGAVTVDHDQMLTNHAQVIRDQGNRACSYCHQPVYCARCHNEPVLDQDIPAGTSVLDPAPGMAWRLVITTAWHPATT